MIYALAQSEWGQGLGTEVAKTILDHGFGTLHLVEIFATVHEDNHASLSVLGKLGFRQVRTITNDDGHVTVVLVKKADP